MPDKTLTTGQTSGLTQIPPQTLRRYISDYRQFFSESAHKRTKGRRFTQQDIETLLLIRRLYFERCKPERIRAALSGEWIPQAKPVYDALDALNLVEAARQEKQDSQDFSRQAKASAQDARWTIQAAEHTLQRFRKVIEAREIIKDQIPSLLSKITDLEKRIAQLEEKSKNYEPKRRGIFGLG